MDFFIVVVMIIACYLSFGNDMGRAFFESRQILNFGVLKYCTLRQAYFQSSAHCRFHSHWPLFFSWCLWWAFESFWIKFWLVMNLGFWMTFCHLSDVMSILTKKGNYFAINQLCATFNNILLLFLSLHSTKSIKVTMPSGNVMTIPFGEDQIDFSNFEIKITHEINKPCVWRKWQSIEIVFIKHEVEIIVFTTWTNASSHEDDSHTIKEWWHSYDSHWWHFPNISYGCENIEKSPKEYSEEDLGIQLTFSSNCLAYFIRSIIHFQQLMSYWMIHVLQYFS